MKNYLKIKLILTFSLFTALLRVAGATLPFFPMGFSPMESVSLFSTRLIKRTWLAFLFPLIIIVSTDSVINFFFMRHFSPFYPGFYWQYLSYFLVTLLGKFMLDSGLSSIERSLSFKRVIIASTASSTVFFLVSNFGVFLSSSLYP